MVHVNETAADFGNHHRSYETFIRISTIAVFVLLAHVVALAIGGLTHLWSLAMLGIVLSVAAAIIGAAVKGLDWKPVAVVLFLLLLTLLLVTH